MNNQEALSKRIDHYLDCFQEFKKRLYRAEVSSFIGIDETKLALAIGFYFKDRDRIKAEHQLKKMHRSKVAAYTIHWLTHFRPIFCTLSKEELAKFPEEEQDDILHANDRFAICLLFQILEELNPEDFTEHGKYNRVILDLSFHLFTNNYNPEMASVLFAALVASSPPVNEIDDPPLGV